MPRAGDEKPRVDWTLLKLRVLMLLRGAEKLRDMPKPPLPRDILPRDMLPPDIPPREILPRDMPPCEPPLPALAGAEMAKAIATAATTVQDRFIVRFMGAPALFAVG